MLREEEKSHDDLATGVRDARLVRIVERSLTLPATSWLLLSNSTIFLRSAVLSLEADLFKLRVVTWERLEQHENMQLTIISPGSNYLPIYFHLYFQFSIYL